MTFLPIVERELRVAARRRHTYWTRFFAALFALGLSVWVWSAAAETQAAHERGKLVFQFIAGMAFTYSILAGISITSDCLSEEKREGTLGLLFLTDLTGYDVVLGKLAATSLNALYRLFSVFPILAIPLLLGALTLGEFWRMALVLTNTLFFSLSAGLVISSISVRERRAMAGTVVLLLAVTAVPPLLGFLWVLKHPSTPFNTHWLLSSTLYPVVLAFDAGYKADARLFWSATALTQVLAWTFLAAACVLVRRSWQDRAAAGPRALWRERWRQVQFGAGHIRADYRQRLLDINPVFWLTGRDRLKPAYVFTFLGMVGLVWVALYAKFREGMLDQTFYLLTAYTLHTVLKLWVASEACRPLAEDRRSGALELVLSTPLPVDAILEGQVLAFKRQFGWPAAAVLAVDLIMLVAGMRDRFIESANDWLVVSVGLMILFLADLYTLVWVGMWLGLRSRRANRAVSGTVARVLVLPWAVFVLGLSFLATVPPQNFDPGETGLLTAAFALSLANDAVFFAWARTNLRERFRLTATERFQSKTPPALRPKDQPSAPAPASPALAQ
jgi:ABC-type transport system involved in cytochrome c biogenesis permease component